MPPERELNTLRERIAESDTIHPEDRAVIEAFDDRLSLLAQEYSTHRHLKLLRHVTIIAESNAIDGTPGPQMTHLEFFLE
jgi:hypothetical protein